MWLWLILWLRAGFASYELLMRVTERTERRLGPPLR